MQESRKKAKRYSLTFNAASIIAISASLASAAIASTAGNPGEF